MSGKNTNADSKNEDREDKEDKKADKKTGLLELKRMKIKRGYIGRIFGSGKHAKTNYLGISTLMLVAGLVVVVVGSAFGALFGDNKGWDEESKAVILYLMSMITGLAGYLGGNSADNDK